jgi:[acyl-carrier-protein] S-malonyltransferase
VVFPGLAPSNFTSVGHYMTRDPSAMRWLARAADILGFSLVARLRTGGPESAVHEQLAFLVNCLALADWAVRELGMRADVCVPGSFGQLAAACFVGSLSYEQTLDLTLRSAKAEQEYFFTHPGLATQFFCSVTTPNLERLLEDHREGGGRHEESCDLGRGFYGITVAEPDLVAFARRIRAVGGVPLHVMRPPMHCRSLGPLRRHLEQSVYPGMDFADPVMPVVRDRDGAVVTSGEGVRDLLLGSVDGPVRWPSVLDTMTRMGVRRVFVPGPGNVFDRLMPADMEVTVVNPERALAVGVAGQRHVPA